VQPVAACFAMVLARELQAACHGGSLGGITLRSFRARRALPTSEKVIYASFSVQVDSTLLMVHSADTARADKFGKRTRRAGYDCGFIRTVSPHAATERGPTANGGTWHNWTHWSIVLKRPEQHVTDSQADAIFRAAFSEWAVNASQRDYGWDYVVEVFRDGNSTGLTFNAQLKGSLHTRYSSDGAFVSQPLEQDAAEYLSRQLRQPTFLFHADVQRKGLFWSAIQLDEKVADALERGETQSLTVRLPTSNALPDQMSRFLKDLTQSQMVVVSRILLGTQPADFVQAMKGQPIKRRAEVAKDLHEKGFYLDLQTAHDLRRDGDMTGAKAAVRKVLASSAAYLEIQFNATLQLGDLEMLELMKSDKPQSLIAECKLATAQDLCRIAKRIPRHLHLFAQTTRKAGELGVAVHKTAGLLMSWQGHLRKGDDPLWLAILSFQLDESLVAAHRKYRQSLRLAQAIARSQYRWVTSRPIVEVAVQITTLAAMLGSAGFKDAAEQYRASAFELVKFAAAIATENENMDELFNAVTHARMIEQEKDGEIFRWIRSVIDKWPDDSEYRKNAEELLQRWMARKEGVKFEGDVETNHLQIHQNILTSAGIDPTVEPWVSLIELAIKDDDPTRVLKECQHKLVFPDPNRDLILDRLGLERANPKILGCQLHGYVVGGPDLDGIDERFKQMHCNSCPDKLPCPDDWTYFSDERRRTLPHRFGKAS